MCYYYYSIFQLFIGLTSTKNETVDAGKEHDASINWLHFKQHVRDIYNIKLITNQVCLQLSSTYWNTQLIDSSLRSCRNCWMHSYTILLCKRDLLPMRWTLFSFFNKRPRLRRGIGCWNRLPSNYSVKSNTHFDQDIQGLKRNSKGNPSSDVIFRYRGAFLVKLLDPFLFFIHSETILQCPYFKYLLIIIWFQKIIFSSFNL